MEEPEPVRVPLGRRIVDMFRDAMAHRADRVRDTDEVRREAKASARFLEGSTSDFGTPPTHPLGPQGT